MNRVLLYLTLWLRKDMQRLFCYNAEIFFDNVKLLIVPRFGKFAFALNYLQSLHSVSLLAFGSLRAVIISNKIVRVHTQVMTFFLLFS